MYGIAILSPGPSPAGRRGSARGRGNGDGRALTGRNRAPSDDVFPLAWSRRVTIGTGHSTGSFVRATLP